jgi:3-hydroxyacyl-[acyl-carrier-protein] dehydratase
MKSTTVLEPRGSSLGFEEVRSLLLQRFPFLMVDRVLEYVPGKSVRTLKNVTGNEFHFMGHFPDRAVMPGVLIVEAMAQTVGLLTMLGVSTELTPQQRLGYLASANVSFHQTVTPGDQLEIEAELVRRVGRFLVAKVVARAGKVAAQGEIVIGLGPE